MLAHVIAESSAGGLMDRAIESLLEKFLNRVLERYSPEKILLFGSYASDDAGPDSDIDLLIVMDTEGSSRQKANEIDLLMSDRSVPMDFLVLTPEQYERQKNLIGTLVYEAEREGKVIYERAA